MPLTLNVSSDTHYVKNLYAEVHFYAPGAAKTCVRCSALPGALAYRISLLHNEEQPWVRRTPTGLMLIVRSACTAFQQQLLSLAVERTVRAAKSA
jgi:hypothetical protein